MVYTRRVLPVRRLDSGRHGAGGRPMSSTAPAGTTAGSSPASAAAAIALGVGQAGANRDYLLNTVAHLRAMGVHDAGLARIAALLPTD